MRTRLAALRSAKHWTQEELAFRAGVSRTQVTRLEQGKLNATLDTLEKIAAALGVEVGDIVGTEGDARLAELYSVWSILSPERRKLALGLLESLKPETAREE